MDLRKLGNLNYKYARWCVVVVDVLRVAFFFRYALLMSELIYAHARTHTHVYDRTWRRRRRKYGHALEQILCLNRGRAERAYTHKRQECMHEHGDRQGVRATGYAYESHRKHAHNIIYGTHIVCVRAKYMHVRALHALGSAPASSVQRAWRLGVVVRVRETPGFFSISQMHAAH